MKWIPNCNPTVWPMNSTELLRQTLSPTLQLRLAESEHLLFFFFPHDLNKGVQQIVESRRHI